MPNAPDSAEPPREAATELERLRDPEWVAAVVRTTVRWRLSIWPGRRIGQDEEDDIVNLALASLYIPNRSALDRFDPTLASARTYVRSLTTRRIVELERKHLRRAALENQHLALEAPESPPDDPEAWFRYHEAVDHIIGRLRDQASDLDQKVFYWIFVENLSHGDVAAKLGVRPSRVADRIFAIRKQISRYLAEFGISLEGRMKR